MTAPRLPRDDSTSLGWLGCLLALVVGAATWGGLYVVGKWILEVVR